MLSKIPGTKNNTNFWSSGVSVVLHPKNPKIPAMHFNTRFICTKNSWFGGGLDATPCIIDKKEKNLEKLFDAYKAVKINSGKSEIRFVYKPFNFYFK